MHKHEKSWCSFPTQSKVCAHKCTHKHTLGRFGDEFGLATRKLKSISSQLILLLTFILTLFLALLCQIITAPLRRHRNYDNHNANNPCNSRNVGVVANSPFAGTETNKHTANEAAAEL